MTFKDGQSPLLLKYEKAYQANPNSRVFAPLAEAYRKLGMLDKAFDILKKGVRNHPTYVLGLQGLAAYHFELGEYETAYSAIASHINKNRDNLRLQKLFAEICRKIGKLDEALEAYKYLLFINPKDNEVAALVAALENKEISSVIGSPQKVFLPAHSENTKENLDDWSQVNLADHGASEQMMYEKDALTIEDDWTMDKDITLTTDNETEAELQDTANDIEVAEDKCENSKNKVSKTKEESITPVMTHALVDLYIGQGHLEKAKEILQKLLELNPQAEETKNKLSEVCSILSGVDSPGENMENNRENLGYTDLMVLYDQKVGSGKGPESSKNKRKILLYQFLDALKARAKQYKSDAIAN